MQGLQAGAEDFLGSPVDRAELCVRVRNLLRLRAVIDDAHAVTAAALPRWRPPVRRLRLPLAMWAGAAMLAAILFAATFAPLLTRYDPVKTDLGSSLQPASAAHPLGTDNFGRDILTRLLYGARVDLQIGLVPT